MSIAGDYLVTHCVVMSVHSSRIYQTDGLVGMYAHSYIHVQTCIIHYIYTQVTGRLHLVMCAIAILISFINYIWCNQIAGIKKLFNQMVVSLITAWYLRGNCTSHFLIISHMIHFFNDYNRLHFHIVVTFWCDVLHCEIIRLWYINILFYSMWTIHYCTFSKPNQTFRNIAIFMSTE